jgi:hypothetical protein
VDFSQARQNGVGFMTLFVTSIVCAGRDRPVPLKLEHRTALHVGQRAVLRLPKGCRLLGEPAGNSLTLLKHVHRRGRTKYFFRAAHPGDETILIYSPADMAKRRCDSCAEWHYFVNVLP